MDKKRINESTFNPFNTDNKKGFILASITAGFGILATIVTGYSIIELIKNQNTMKSYETIRRYELNLTHQDMKRLNKQIKENQKKRDKEIRDRAKYLLKNKLV